MSSLLAVAAIIAVTLYLAHVVVSAVALLTAWRRRIAVGLLIAPGLVIAAWVLGVPLPWQLPTTALSVAVVVLWRRWLHTANVVTRWGDSQRRKRGVASTIDLLRHSSALALRRNAAIVRPSLAELSRWQRLRTPAMEFATPVARAGIFRRQIWTSREHVIVLFGGPRKGKTGTLGGQIIDAPGAVLATSTRADLYTLTCGLREEKGPVLVFNAVGLGGIGSTLQFDPLTGCADPVAAFERATDLLAGATAEVGADGDMQYWITQARRVLAALLHAAALGDRTMSDVLAWVADPKANQRLLNSLLRRSSQPAYVADVDQFVGTNDRTRTSISSTIMPALGWLTSPAAVAATTPGSKLDVEQLLRDHATVYLLGEDETQSAPLITALTGLIAREARRIAGRSPSGRLDPPLTLVLDEAGELGPPLESWTADMGGRGVTIIAAFQSWSQVLARWSDADAGTIVNNAATVMLFGGTKNHGDLDYWATLAGERDEEAVHTDEHGRIKSRSMRKVPVFTPAQIRTLPPAHVIVFHDGMPPVLGRTQMVWERRDVRGTVTVRARLAALAERLRLRRRRAPAFEIPGS